MSATRANLGVRERDIYFEYGRRISRKQMESGTIYLDGVVQGPVIDNDRRSYSFDHHGDCVRMATLSTCEQVWLALWLGLDPTGMKVVLNDLDADASIALWLLRNPWGVEEERVEKLVRDVGFVDSHGPLVTPNALHVGLSHFGKTEQTMEMLWQDQELIDRWYSEGDAALPEPAPREPVFAFGLTRQGEIRDFPQVEGFAELYAEGVMVAVICPEAPGDTRGYTVGKRSEFVRFDMPRLFARLNQVEPGWGGGSTIGGAPRNEGGRRSKLPLDVLRKYFKEEIQRNS